MHSNYLALKHLLREHVFKVSYPRTLCTKVAVKERKKKVRVKDPVLGECPSQEQTNYFQSSNNHRILESVPPTLLKCDSRYKERYYVASTECAKVICGHLTDAMPQDTFLTEINPGPGTLTREIVRKKFGSLMLIEKDAFFEPGLKQLIASLDSSVSKQIRFKLDDFNAQGRYSYLDSIDEGNRMKKLLDGLPRKQWEDEGTNLRLFSAVDTMAFFKSLINGIQHQKDLFTLGRCEMYLAVPPLIYKQLTCTKEAGYKFYRSGTVLFQLFFEHEFLTKLKRRDFLPWPPNSVARKIKTQFTEMKGIGTEEWYLMRVIPRKDLFDNCLVDNLNLLSFFVYQHLISRKNRIIPALERWIPTCGTRLILHHNYTPSNRIQANVDEQSAVQLKSSPLKKNDFPPRINIYTEFGELTPSQILALFNEFINWPEFQQSPFLQALEQYSVKQRFVRSNHSAGEDALDDGFPESEDPERNVT
ncbi:dimethyladenosine transferase 2, mitochondrial [Toxorhynchites rutilus septentrionalis]|uniref:dimethyladenosine transferase 2, mitochondrial n=1 Tax=Toxorhynchites rutilus septentrionalis TaxID=329112 RepID=UPI00247A0A68|nr:dimethyladenosine transferase 2, mitochondrial [Toxorhynchites rutilus septentrionalis]